MSLGIKQVAQQLQSQDAGRDCGWVEVVDLLSNEAERPARPEVDIPTYYQTLLEAC